MKAIFHPEAHQEMIESARFYEEKSEGLGTDFLTAVENTTRRIEEILKQARWNDRISASGLCPVSRSPSYTKYRLIRFS